MARQSTTADGIANPAVRDPLPDPLLNDCITAAVAAPSVYNTQPWLFHRRRGTIDVYADRDRQLRVIDPAGRDLFISVGAAVFNLRVALRASGRVPELRLLPEPAAPNLLANVAPGVSSPATMTASALARAIPRRRSNRWPFHDMPLPGAFLAELVATAAAEGAVLSVTNHGAGRRIRELLRIADRERSEDDAYRAELAAWMRPGPYRRDGIHPSTIGPRSAADALPLRDFGLLLPPGRRTVAVFEPRPTLAVLYSVDTPTGWLRAGQALQRILLTATVRGVAVSLITHPLEIRWLRRTLQELGGQQAQVIVRLGYRRWPASPSPRRSQADVVLPNP
jgi:nitroreductase